MARIRLFLILLFVVPLAYKSFCSHIVGGNIQYQYLGNNQYAVQVVYYGDCLGIPLPDSVFLDAVTDTIVGTFGLAQDSNVVLEVVPPDCLISQTTLCRTQGWYSGIITVPTSNLSTYLLLASCCRNNAIINSTTDSSLFACSIPPGFNNQPLINSNPVFGQIPPILLCVNTPLNLSQIAIDPDGDSLAYEMYQPFKSYALDPLTFYGISWLPGYTTQQPIPSSVPLSLNPVTAVLSATPNAFGTFLLGIAVKEYRNGQLLSTTYRDIQITIAECQPPLPLSVEITASGLDCPGDVVTLLATGTGGIGNYQFNWPGPGNNQTSNFLNFIPTANESYVVTLTDVVCGDTLVTTDTLQLVIPVITPINIATIPNRDVICAGTPTTLSPSVTGGNGTLVYTWLPGGQFSQDITVSPNVTTNYILTVTGACGTQDTLHVRVNVPVYPGLALSMRDTTVQCAGDVGVLLATASGGAPGKQYAFNGGPFLPGNQFSLPVPNNLDVIVVAKDTCGTQASDTATVTIPLRAPVVALGGVDTAACPGQFAHISVVGQGGLAPYTYQWSAFTGNDTIVNPIADTTSVIARGTHTYRIVVTDVCGTTAEDTLMVETKVSCSISIPNIFTPNGTGGNERFIISGIAEFPNTQVTIYDRWGNRVQQWDNYTDENAWDGKGSETGTYYYTVEFLGVRKPLNGFVTLLR